MHKTTKNEGTKETKKDQERILKDTIDGIMDEDVLKFVNMNLDIAKFKTVTMNIGIPDKAVVRYLVDSFYQVQDLRKASESQQRSTIQEKDGDGYDLPLFILGGIANIEGQIKKIIDIVTDKIPICWYMKQIKGVGPMISAYLYAYLDIDKASSAGSFWTYCGLNDNNTPWLGKEKSATYSKKIIEQIMGSCETETKFINEYLTKTDITKIMKSIITRSKKNYGSDVLIDEFHVQDYLQEKRPDIFTEFERRYSDYCEDGISRIKVVWAFIFAYDHNFITQEIINRLATMKGVNRHPSQISDGAISQHNTGTGSKKQYITKEDLDKFMAKPPYNKSLKVMMFKIQDCIMKQSNRPGSIYGKLYKERLGYELAKNEAGDYAKQAENILATKNITDKATRECLESGKLTLAHIYRRSLRWMSKLMLSHLYEAWYIIENGELPRVPYILLHGTVDGKNVMSHTDYIKPEVPYKEVLKHFNLPIPEGLDEFPKLSDMNRK